MSFNLLRKVEGLEQLASLKKLFLLHNKISSIANLDRFPCLEMLELGSNRIRVRPPWGRGHGGGGATGQLLICVSLQVIENLDALSSLQSLFLGTNKITKLQNLDGLHHLTVLSIQVSPRRSGLHAVGGGTRSVIEHPFAEQSDHQTGGSAEPGQSEGALPEPQRHRGDRGFGEQREFQVCSGDSPWPVACGSCPPWCLQKKLTTLDIAANRIRRIENIGHLTELQEFWVCSIGSEASAASAVFHL